MKITKRQLTKIVQEQIATVNKDAIEDVVMSILSDEGGAAGLEPIEDALEGLEDDDVSLPDEPIEDVIDDVAGVKRHADGDYIDTTKLESKRIRVTKRQLRQIIKEERAKLQEKASFGLTSGERRSIDDMKYQFEKEINAKMSLENRFWYKEDDVMLALLEMLDELKTTIEEYGKM